jgi:hypothetical protein
MTRIPATQISAPTKVTGTLTDSAGDEEPIALVATSGVTQPPAAGIFLQEYWLDKSETHSSFYPATMDEHLETASCGSTSAVAALARYGKFATVEGVDQHTRRPNDLGGSHDNLVDFLRSRGLEAEQHDGGSWDDLKTALSAGCTVSVTYAHDQSMHTVLVTGILKAQDGKEYIRLQSWDGGPPLIMTRAEFEKQWADLSLPGLGGLKTGIGNTYTVIAEKGTKMPSGGSVWGGLNAVSSHVIHDGFSDCASGIGYMRHGEVLGGLAQFTSGFIQCAVQLPAAIGQVAGAGLEWIGDKALDYALRVFKGPSSGWEQLAAIFALIFGGLLFVLGTVLRHTAQIFGALTGTIARLLAKPFGALGEWLHKDDEVKDDLRFSDPTSGSRGAINYMQLVRTPLAGKLQLIDALASGHVTEEERQMILRVVQASGEPDAAKNEQAQLVAAAGKRLDALFKGTPENAAWQTLRAPPAPLTKPTTKPAKNSLDPSIVPAGPRL